MIQSTDVLLLYGDRSRLPHHANAYAEAPLHRRRQILRPKAMEAAAQRIVECAGTRIVGVVSEEWSALARKVLIGLSEGGKVYEPVIFLAERATPIRFQHELSQLAALSQHVGIDSQMDVSSGVYHSSRYVCGSLTLDVVSRPSDFLSRIADYEF
ncbi:hypothetical protein KC959_03460 [Candidatus Saccharibacteria bacterium]|nr:hypothetical protein [Candidatus Saccharibacteria bacterium]